jgi:predicted aspartyl protease
MIGQGDSNRPQPYKFRYTSSGRPICNFCHGAGHIQRNCWHRNNQKGFDRRSRSNNQDNRSRSRDWDRGNKYRNDRRGGSSSDRNRGNRNYRDNSSDRNSSRNRSNGGSRERGRENSDRARSSSRDSRDGRDDRDNDNYRRHPDSRDNSAERNNGKRGRSPIRRDNSGYADDGTRKINVVSDNRQAGTLSLAGHINDHEIRFMVDTGADASLISSKLWQELGVQIEPTDDGSQAFSANDEPIKLMGTVQLTVTLTSTTHSDRPIQLTQRFLIADQLTHEAILGMDFISAYKADIFASDRKLQITVQGNTSTHRLLSADGDNYVACATVAETVAIPARSCTYVPLCAVPIGNDSGSIHEKAALFVPSETAFVRSGILLPYAVVDLQGDEVVLNALNAGTCDVVLRVNTKLGYFTSVDPSKVRACGLNVMDSLATSTDSDRTIGKQEAARAIKSLNLPEFMNKLDIDTKGLKESELQALKQVLIKRQAAFSKHKRDLGFTDLVECTIDTGDAAPVSQPPRRLTPPQREFVEKQLKEWEEDGIIEPDTGSPWCSPVVLVPKGNGYRICTDMRRLNNVTRKDTFPLPRIDDTLDHLQGSSYFSLLDLNAAYMQVGIAKEDRYKTAFAVGDKKYVYRRLNFGLTVAPALFSRLMNIVLSGIKWHYCLNYLDDIIIYSSTVMEGIHRLDAVLQRLIKAGLKCQVEKVKLLHRRVKILGFIVEAGRLAKDPEKINAFKQLLPPRNLKEMRSLLGAFSYYRVFCRNFAAIAAPLHALTEKNKKFVWGEAQQQAFEKLKEEMTKNVILHMPDFRKEFILTCDASDTAIGATLGQRDPSGIIRPVSFASKCLTKPQRAWSITERELFACCHFIQFYKQYLMLNHFTLQTDHNAILWLKTSKHLTPKLVRMGVLLSTYNFTIEHIPGKLNFVADALSRLPREKVTVASVDFIQLIGPVTMDDIKDAQMSDYDINLFEHLRRDEYIDYNDADLTQTVKSMLKYRDLFVKLRGIWYKARDTGDLVPVLPSKLHEVVISHLHDAESQAHCGLSKTLARVNQRVYFPNITKIVKDYIKRCQLCTMMKRPKYLVRAPLNPLQPTYPFEMVAMDITGPFPPTVNGNIVIFVIIDLFTRFPEAYCLKDQKSETLARCVEEFICRYGKITRVISDQGRNLMSKTMQQLCELFHIKKVHTSAYHPAANGACEKANGILNKRTVTLCEYSAK